MGNVILMPSGSLPRAITMPHIIMHARIHVVLMVERCYVRLCRMKIKSAPWITLSRERLLIIQRALKLVPERFLINFLINVNVAKKTNTNAWLFTFERKFQYEFFPTIVFSVHSSSTMMKKIKKQSRIKLFQHSTSIFIPREFEGRLTSRFWRCANAPANYPQSPPFFGRPLLSQWRRRAQFSGSTRFHPLFLLALSEESGVKRNICVSFNDRDGLKVADDRGRRRVTFINIDLRKYFIIINDYTDFNYQTFIFIIK